MAGKTDIPGLTVQRYQEIIDGVVGKVRADFNQEGVDESVLDEVRALWEAKLVATGVIGEPSNEGQQVIQQQQLPRPGVPGALPLTAIQQQQLLAMRAAAAAGMPHMLVPGGAPAGVNMAALQAMMQAQAMQAQAQAAAAADQKRKLKTESSVGEVPEAKMQRTMPQQDGPADEAGGGGDDMPGGGGEGGEAAAAEEEDDDPLTEDDEGSGDEVDEAAVADVVLGQFEKVQRSKAKWKIVLKDCILTLSGRDYLVRKATGEMDFL